MSDRLRGEVAEAGTWPDSLVANAPLGLGFWDTDLRYQRVNDRLAESNGVPAEDHVGRALREDDAIVVVRVTPSAPKS